MVNNKKKLCITNNCKKHRDQISHFYDTKDSLLRAITEVAPEMELFQENHGQHMKNFVIELIYIQSCTFRHFTKKLYLAGYV